jgi:hypothetical protein
MQRRLTFLGLALVTTAVFACQSYPEVSIRDKGLIGSGGTGDGGQAGEDTKGIGGSIIITTTTSTSSGGAGGAPPIEVCGATTCSIGQRCEDDDGDPVCIDNECSDLDCTELEECLPATGGGNVCASNACESDVDCAVSRYCDGEKCVDDVCEPGAQRCDGAQVFQCASNGGDEVARFACGGDAYFQSNCQESDTSGVGCSCEDDWDCPSFTNCEVGTCKGSGVEPTCTLPAVPFEQVLPSLEYRWGGESEANPAATGSPYPNSNQVVATPLVANLTDDNGDGFINELDFPEIIFLTYPNAVPHDNGVVRAIHGGGESKGQDYFALCGTTHWFQGDAVDTGNCSNADALGRAGGGLAVGDLNYDGVPEIVVSLEDGRLQILNNRGQVIHTSQKISIGQGDPDPDDGAWKYPQVAIANLDNQGLVEIVLGHQVITLAEGGTDALEVLDVFEGQRTQGAQTHGNDPRHLGPNVCIANIVDADPADDDVSQEIVAGTTVYRLPTPPGGVSQRSECDGADMSPFCLGQLEEVWNAQDVNGTGDDQVPDPEAFCAVADVWGASSAAPGPDNPLDGTPEVILVSEAHMLILDGASGSLIDNIEVDTNNAARGGGAPNIDDFDGDGFPEIASAMRYIYAVVDLQAPVAADCPAWPTILGQDELTPGGNPARSPGGACTSDSECSDGAVCAEGTGTCVCLHNGWMRTTEDDSSYATGSSVFDFNGDGAAEVVYNDECYFRVYNGVDGAIMFDPPSLSRTAIENPVVADVDNDGNAEIVFVTNNETIQCDQSLEDPNGDPVDEADLPNGVQVWGDAADTWVSARRIWNQHAYHVTNVTEGGGIPIREPESWRPYGNRLYNTYRSQPRSFGVAPDLALTAMQISSPNVACGELSDEILIVVEVRNEGDLRVGPGVALTFYGTFDGDEEALLDEGGDPLTVTLETSLEPGASIIVTAPYTAGANTASGLPSSVTVMIDEDDRERECGDDSNNSISDDVEEGESVADLRLEIGAATGPCTGKDVEVTVHNDGSLAASSILVRLYAGDPSSGGQVIGEATIDESIEPGDSVMLEIRISALLRNATIFGIADPLGAIPECNEANNRAEGPQVVCGGIF